MFFQLVDQMKIHLSFVMLVPDATASGIVLCLNFWVCSVGWAGRLGKRWCDEEVRSLWHEAAP